MTYRIPFSLDPCQTLETDSPIGIPCSDRLFEAIGDGWGWTFTRIKSEGVGHVGLILAGRVREGYFVYESYLFIFNIQTYIYICLNNTNITQHFVKSLWLVFQKL